MGVVLMSKRELNRIDILARLDGGRLTPAAAADLMRLTQRQTQRLLKRYRDGGAAAIATSPQRRPRLPQKLPSDILTLQSKGHLNLVATKKTENGTCSTNVRSWRKSGRHPLNLSISHFDPERK